MTDLTLRYRHNVDPDRGLATAGIFFLKFLLAVPHFIITEILWNLTWILAYFGYWIVAITGQMPQAVHRLAEITFGWTTRMWAWIAGVVDLYPPFETDPEYPASFPLAKPENPGRGWAVAGIFLLKVVASIPHIIVLVFLVIGAILAMWFGYLVAAFTGRLPAGIQDFLAGVLQWNLRVYAWVAGFTDEYPPFSLDAQASSDQSD